MSNLPPLRPLFFVICLAKRLLFGPITPTGWCSTVYLTRVWPRKIYTSHVFINLEEHHLHCHLPRLTTAFSISQLVSVALISILKVNDLSQGPTQPFPRLKEREKARTTKKDRENLDAVQPDLEPQFAISYIPAFFSLRNAYFTTADSTTFKTKPNPEPEHWFPIVLAKFLSTSHQPAFSIPIKETEPLQAAISNETLRTFFRSCAV